MTRLQDGGVGNALLLQTKKDFKMSAGFSLVADTGGTNTRVALAKDGVVDQDSIRRYRNAQASGMDDILRQYLGDIGVANTQISGACVAIAGPVRDGVAEMTNLDWRIDRDMLADVLTAKKLAVLNDLQAQGHAIGHLEPRYVTQILPQPEASLHAAKLVIGLGTGFNAAPVFDTAAGRFVPPSESGHISLPWSGNDGDAIALALRGERGFASVEDILSGRGIERLHRFLHDHEVSAADIMAALETGDAQAETTARLFVKILGTVVGDLALINLPFGGIYLIGGVSRAIAPYLERFGFAQSLQAKGRFQGFMEQFGVFVVSDDYAALTGCAAHLSHL